MMSRMKNFSWKIFFDAVRKRREKNFCLTLDARYLILTVGYSPLITRHSTPQILIYRTT